MSLDRAWPGSATLRAAINFGNPVLAQRGADGAAGGVSVMLAGALARRLDVPLTIVPFQSAGEVVDSLAQDRFDVAFLAVDPVRGQGLDFTAPYVLIEGGYAVRDASPITEPSQVDVPGVTVVVGRGSAYDLHLSRTLVHAALVRLPSGVEAAAAFLDGTGDVLAGVRQVSVRLVAATPGLWMVPGRFMVIAQAMAVPKGQAPGVMPLLEAFLGEMKASGAVAQALAATGQHDAAVAP